VRLRVSTFGHHQAIVQYKSENVMYLLGSHMFKMLKRLLLSITHVKYICVPTTLSR